MHPNDPSGTMSKTNKTDAKKSVLIVEDSIDFSNLLKFIVEDDGFEGIQFPVQQEDIISAVKQHQPAVILMDLALRRKGGIDYINDLKGDPATKDVPIIIISGRELGQKDIIELQMKGVRYLRKGRVEMHEIRREIRTAALGKEAAAAMAKNSPSGTHP
ncbi:Phosphate regulon transcriptional regulatory protein PhoB [Anaerolineae bacterium]|nr:Phosphate regulon transcriptional regulatory protein PhoB [Anaerolineae bacterium]